MAELKLSHEFQARGIDGGIWPLTRLARYVLCIPGVEKGGGGSADKAKCSACQLLHGSEQAWIELLVNVSTRNSSSFLHASHTWSGRKQWVTVPLSHFEEEMKKRFV